MPIERIIFIISDRSMFLELWRNNGVPFKSMIAIPVHIPGSNPTITGFSDLPSIPELATAVIRDVYIGFISTLTVFVLTGFISPYNFVLGAYTINILLSRPPSDFLNTRS